MRRRHGRVPTALPRRGMAHEKLTGLSLQAFVQGMLGRCALAVEVLTVESVVSLGLAKRSAHRRLAAVLMRDSPRLAECIPRRLETHV